MPRYITQRCRNCDKVFRAKQHYTWCFLCHQADPEGAQLASDRGLRSGWIAKLGRMENHLPIVYAVHLGDNRVKIGTTTSIKKRLQSYRVIVPHADAFWGTWGTATEEDLYHEALDQYRIGNREVFVLGDTYAALLKLEDAERRVKADRSLAA